MDTWMLSSFRAVLLLTILTAFIYHSTLWEISASTTGLSGDAGAASASEAGKASEDLSSASGDHSGYITGSMTGKPAAVPKGTTTMYVSSWLSGRHGLCVLLENVDQAGNHRFGMIDTGNAGSAAMKSFLQSHGVKSLEFLILTHMHDDHIGNAVYLLKNYPVKSLYLKQFDAHWSDGLQATYEKILRAAASNASTKKITGVSYALSLSKAASPSASAGLISWLQSHPGCKSRFKGLFTDSNISFGFGSSKVQLFNWEIWSTDGVTRWQPGRTKRCRAAAFANENSDNHFSLGVRVTQGSRRFWIGGDMNNLRLVHKKGSPYKGDEDRIRASVGRVDAMVMNHHGRGGSNTPSFLRTLSPSYAVYTSLRLEVESSSSDRARTSFLYLRNNLHVPEDHILWACNHWKFYPEDPVITISSSELVSTKKDGTDMTHWKGAGGANCAVIHLIPAHSYTSYDLTGDGKADRIQIFSRGSGKLRSSLTIRVNQKDVFSFKKNYSDAQPVTLLLQPGHRAFLCISILSPKDEKSRILRLYRCRTVSAVPSLEKTFDFIQKMPDAHFTYGKAPVIRVSPDRITLSCTGPDSLGSRIMSGRSPGSGSSRTSGKASGKNTGSASGQGSGNRSGSASGNGSGSTPGSVSTYGRGNTAGKEGTFTFCLVPDGKGLKTASSACRYSLGRDSLISFQDAVPLYSTVNAHTAGGQLPSGTAVTVTHACKTKAGALRYRITTPDGKNWWIE